MCVCTHALTEAERTLSEVQSCTSASPPVISVGHMQKDPPCAARAAHRARMTLCWSPGFIVPDDGEKNGTYIKCLLVGNIRRLLTPVCLSYFLVCDCPKVSRVN